MKSRSIRAASLGSLRATRPRSALFQAQPSGFPFITHKNIGLFTRRASSIASGRLVRQGMVSQRSSAAVGNTAASSRSIGELESSGKNGEAATERRTSARFDTPLKIACGSGTLHNHMRTMWTLLLGAVALIVVAPMVLTLVACRTLLYHPTQDRAADVNGWTVERVSRGDVELVGLVRTPSNAPERYLMFFGGNAAPINGNRALLELFDRTGSAGAAVFSYRGYDSSGGEPEEPLLKADAFAIFDQLSKTRGFEADKLVLIGQSLGSGVASHLAFALAKEGRPPRALVLLSPYTSIARVFDDNLPIIPIGWAVRDPWNTASIAASIPCPVVIVHGAEDTLIPIRHARRLVELFEGRAKLVELAGKGHNDMFSDPRAAEAVRAAIFGP